MRVISIVNNLISSTNKERKMENLLLNLSVKMDGYFGDWKTAIDEAYTLAKKLNIGCSLNYANQYNFIIYPTMSEIDINKLKETRVVIGL